MKKIISIVTACSFMFGTYLTIRAGESKDIKENNTGVLSAVLNTNTSDYANQVATLVNRERAANGLQPVRMSPQLSQAANVRAVEIKQNFSHTRPDGTSCFTAVTDMGITYRYIAENIAYGQKNPDDVMNAWMNSPSHRTNILNGNLEYIGVGVNYDNGIYYWTQFFATSSILSDGSYLPDEQPPATTVFQTTPQTTAVQTSNLENNTTEITTATAVEPVATTVTETSTSLQETKPENTVISTTPVTSPYPVTTGISSECVTTVPKPCNPGCIISPCTSDSSQCGIQTPCTTGGTGCINSQWQFYVPGCNSNDINQIISNIATQGSCITDTSCS